LSCAKAIGAANISAVRLVTHVIVRFMIVFLLSLLPGVPVKRHRHSKVPGGS
jgi:hypothetical protein